MTLALIWAQSANGMIGAEGGIPWHLPEDSRRFRALTSGATVVMGRRTWESLPERFRPLPGRRNVVVSRDASFEAEGAEVVGSVDVALERDSGDVWVIGGSTIYAQTIDRADRLEVTEIAIQVDGDASAPAIDQRWRISTTDPESGWHTAAEGTPYRFVSYVR